MLWRLPNKEIKSYIGKTRNDQGLKLSDNVKLVLIFWAINLKLKILIQVGVNGTNYIMGHHSQIKDKTADLRETKWWIVVQTAGMDLLTPNPYI